MAYRRSLDPGPYAADRTGWGRDSSYSRYGSNAMYGNGVQRPRDGGRYYNRPLPGDRVGRSGGYGDDRYDDRYGYGRNRARNNGRDPYSRYGVDRDRYGYGGGRWGDDRYRGRSRYTQVGVSSYGRSPARYDPYDDDRYDSRRDRYGSRRDRYSRGDRYGSDYDDRFDGYAGSSWNRYRGRNLGRRSRSLTRYGDSFDDDDYSYDDRSFGRRGRGYDDSYDDGYFSDDDGYSRRRRLGRRRRGGRRFDDQGFDSDDYYGRRGGNRRWRTTGGLYRSGFGDPLSLEGYQSRRNWVDSKRNRRRADVLGIDYDPTWR